LITSVLNEKQRPAITSDQWHVVLARWSGERTGEPRFERTIVSEHADMASAMAAARVINGQLKLDMASRIRERRDQLFVRPPEFKSLKNCKRLERRKK
jgi:hypothetical protein